MMVNVMSFSFSLCTVDFRAFADQCSMEHMGLFTFAFMFVLCSSRIES